MIAAFFKISPAREALVFPVRTIPRLRLSGGMAFVALFVSLILSACASLRVETFAGFESSVAVAQKGLEAEMARALDWTREADVNALAEAREAPLSDHMVKEARGTAWSTATSPPHWQVRRTHKALQELNAGFAAYTQLLTRCAAGRSHTSAQTAALAEALNQSLRDAASLSDGWSGADRLAPAGIAALSTEGLAGAGRHGRVRALRALVKANQPWVREYAAHCQALTGLVRSNLKAAYADRMEFIHDRWDDKRTPGRNTLARSIFNLNADYADAMESLAALDLFYGQVPSAHAALAEGSAGGPAARQALADLAAGAGRVARLTRDLEKAR